MCIFSCFTLKIALCSRVNSGAASKWLTLSQNIANRALFPDMLLLQSQYEINCKLVD